MPTNIRVSKIEIEGPLIIDTDFFQDERGFFFESYSYQRLNEHGIDIVFVQDNHSRSSRGVLRGFHFQDRGHHSGAWFGAPLEGSGT